MDGQAKERRRAGKGDLISGGRVKAMLVALFFRLPLLSLSLLLPYASRFFPVFPFLSAWFAIRTKGREKSLTASSRTVFVEFKVRRDKSEREKEISPASGLRV